MENIKNNFIDPSSWKNSPGLTRKTELEDCRKSEFFPEKSFNLSTKFAENNELKFSVNFDRGGNRVLGPQKKSSGLEAINKGSPVFGCIGSETQTFHAQERGKLGNPIEVQRTSPSQIAENRVWSKSLMEETRKRLNYEEAKKNEEKIKIVTRKSVDISSFLSKDGYIESPEYRTISEKIEKSKMEARKNAGLFDSNALKNESLPLSYVRSPKNSSLSDMKDKKKQELVKKLNESADFTHETYYTKIEKEKITAFPTGKILEDIVQSRKNQDLTNLREKFTKEIQGIHKKELPKFEENLYLFNNLNVVYPSSVYQNPFENYSSNLKKPKSPQKLSPKPTEVLHLPQVSQRPHLVNSEFSSNLSFISKQASVISPPKQRRSPVQPGRSIKKKFKLISSELSVPITQRLVQRSCSPLSKYKSISSTGFNKNS